MKQISNVAASERQRLSNLAKSEKVDFSVILTRYSLERFLYRLGLSAYREQFLLKGAMLFDLWFSASSRPTRDIDLLHFGDSEQEAVAVIFKEICLIQAEDGITFNPASVTTKEIRKEANYAGIRVTFSGTLERAVCPMQVDIGYGDAVTPGPENATYPLLLNNMPPPQLKVYPRYTVVAEKFQAIVSLGMANSRLKDYFDLWILSQHAEFEESLLREAILATFKRRKTALPVNTPLGLTSVFYSDGQKQIQWNAFLSKNKLLAPSLPEVTEKIVSFLMPILKSY